MKLIIACLIVLTLTSSATIGQTRRRTAKPPTTAIPKRSEVVNAGALRVADELKKLTRYLFLLGGVAKSIEATDSAARRNQASPAVIEQMNQSKATVRSTLQTMRMALDRLELDFRTNPELNRYYIRLAGAASGAFRAEEQAAANQFDAAGRTLLDVAGRLTDVLLEMR